MNDKLQSLLESIKELEHELIEEIHQKEAKFGFEIREKKVHFKDTIVAQHKMLATRLTRYLYESKPFSILSAPMIWFCIIPILFLDLTVTLYQFICFPVYGIPKVLRKDYIVRDRGALSYLNRIEKLNCTYCEYVNGFLAYAQEVAGRTEQYWCPIKHALKLKTRHSRYHKFLDYGDAEEYRKRVEEVRKAFDDLKKE